MRERRKFLRQNLSEAEKIIWSRLRNGVLGYRFKRQYSVGGYVVDFYCPKNKLAIEIDGGQHNAIDKIRYDKYRTRYLESMGIKVTRFWNNQVINKTDKVIETIFQNLTKI